MAVREGNGKFHIMMCFLVTMWGLEYAVAKDALDSVDTLVIMNSKYLLGALFIAALCIRRGELALPKLRDMPAILATTVLGQIVYFYCEYTALACDVPVANITVIFGFLPVGTILVERIVFKRRLKPILLALMFVCLIGIILTIGVDISSIGGGRSKGYFMALMALFAWLAYLFLTEDTANKYGSLRIALYQTAIAWILTFPVMIPHIPELPLLEHKVILELIYLGIISEGLCFVIEVTGIEKLGSTISAVYSNFLPVTSAFFGVVLLGQDLVLMQYIGGVMVIVSGFFIIREKAKLDSIT